MKWDWPWIKRRIMIAIVISLLLILAYDVWVYHD